MLRLSLNGHQRKVHTSKGGSSGIPAIIVTPPRQANAIPGTVHTGLQNTENNKQITLP